MSVARGVTHLILRGDSSAVYGVMHRLEALGLEVLVLEREPGPR